MKKFITILLFFYGPAIGQKLKKADMAILAGLRTHVTTLSNDKLEGRRTGSLGEKMASGYIIEQYNAIGLLPKGDPKSYIQQFEVQEGRQINPATYLIVNGNDLSIEKDFFPLAFSGNGSLEAAPVIALQEKGMPWFWDIRDVLEKNKANPHFDVTEEVKMKGADAAKKGASALIIFNTSSIDDELKFEGRQKSETINIPVLYISKPAKEKFFHDESSAMDMKLKVDIGEKRRTGGNVIGYIDNGAATTIIVGAHYDHLGYGEDHNSLWTGSRSVHNGADDNASGTAAVIELARLVKNSKLNHHNYLFICFSGEELGLYGSKYFTEHADLGNVDYMINLDMVGRLNDSTHSLIIGGYGTSPSWSSILPVKDKNFIIKFDSSGVGPSDHTSFYRKNIPVLFFFTGTHSDYHKPTDDVDKINFPGEVQIVKYIYKILETTDKEQKLAFLKTREPQMGQSRFTVSLGIMPDYTFNGAGVRADGIVDGKIAQKAGIHAGDIIVQLGDYKFSDVMSYMGVLNKFKRGDATRVKVIRGKEELTFDIVF
ncbi:MAG: M20/M25/M40 family metallo-hydrolase [Ginsengibacter sp.]